MGAARPLPFATTLRLGEPLPGNGGRRTFLRASTNGTTVTSQNVQDSSALASLAASNVLIDRSANAPPIAEGEAVACFWLENGGTA
jgi:molybdopterin molybdotransferase